MRPYPLGGLAAGINRLKVKGGARANQLYDLLNGYITTEGTIAPREGTIRAATLDSTTVGLMAEAGLFNVFSTSLQSVPSGYVCNVLLDPNDNTQALSKIWFAKPFMGFPYVTAQFANGDVFDYWLQSGGVWTADTVYKTGAIVTPTTPNGLAFQAVRDMQVNPTWSAGAIIPSNQIIEPTEYTGFAYQATTISGDGHTGSVEPVWPTVEAGTVKEFGDFNANATNAGTTNASTSAAPQPLDSTITDRYGDSSEIAGQTGATTTTAGTAPTIPTVGAVTVWKPGTLYAPGAVVQPSTSQGAFINAIPNGDFEAGDDGNWTYTAGGAVAFTATNPYQGTECVQMTANHGSVFLTMTNYGLVTPGQSVTASAYLDPHNTGANLGMFVELMWYDSSDTFISVTKSVEQENGGYRKTSVTGTAPTGAAHVRVRIEAGNGTSNHTGYVDLVTWNLETAAPVSNFLYEAVQSSTAASGTTEPAWPTVLGNTVVDGGVTWKAIGTSIITWTAIPIMESGASEPTWPTSPGLYAIDLEMSWVCIDRHIGDTNHPDTIPTALAASHVFKGNKDITSFSAAVDPTDWTSANNAGYLATGLNNYGDNPVAMLALYRSNLMVFNAGGYQMWQVDPDPANMAILDAQPIGSVWPRAAQSVANDLLLLTEVGVRNIGTVGATANMAIGHTGQPVDPIVRAAMRAATYDPLSLYYPGRGQYWLIFGPQAFVLTVNGQGTQTWSRYVFPDAITDWTLNNGVLYLRSAGNLIWQIDDATLVDDAGAVGTGSIAKQGPIATFGSITAGSGYGGPIATITPITGGTLYTTGTYSGVPLTGGNGSGATANITVAGGAVTVCTLVNPGGGYLAADALSATAASIGGTGSGFSIPVATLAAQTYAAVPLTGGTGTGATANITVSASGTVTAVTLVNAGAGYLVTDALSAAAANIGGHGSGFSIPVATTIGGILRMTGITSGTFTVGQTISGTGVTSGTRITSAPASGGIGTYVVDKVQTVASTTITAAGANANFSGVLQWPYLDMGSLGINKMLVGVDLVGTGQVTVQIGWDETDPTTFSDNAGFATSTKVTAPYTISMADTLPGEPLPIPINAPSYSLVLTFGPNQTWSWQAANLYLTDARGAGATG